MQRIATSPLLNAQSIKIMDSITTTRAIVNRQLPQSPRLLFTEPENTHHRPNKNEKWLAST